MIRFYRPNSFTNLQTYINHSQLPMQYNKNIDLSTILKDVARKSVISEVPLIKRAITYNQQDDLVLKTDGINIVKMFEYNDLLDINRLYTNDIHAMARTYGIEAAARVIVKVSVVAMVQLICGWVAY